MTTLTCSRMTLAPGMAAVVAPVEIAERALASVAEAVPAIVHSSGETAWVVLLVRAATEADRARLAALSDRGIGYLASGQHIDLPPTSYPDGPLAWRDDTTADQPWPPFAAVADALLAVTS